MKHFCTAGPIKPEIHYSVSPLLRIDWPQMSKLIGDQKYFVLHAPRQTGKTSCLIALAAALNETGRYRALYVNIESAQTAREDVGRAMRSILSDLGAEAAALGDTFPETIREEVLGEAIDSPLRRMLERWSALDPRPVVLMIDEIDALVGDTLISVLRQLRSGYPSRPKRFPQSVILCGVRDVRDYRIHSSSTKEIITGGSAFNIKAESLLLGNFTPEHIRALYEQHTAETGQRFDEDVYPLVWELTRGQPWLVNALAYDACFRFQRYRDDRTLVITRETIEEAKEQLIQRRETHLDQLSDKLKEERVRRVIQPILASDDQSISTGYEDDAQYVLDLGLIRHGNAGFEIANGIYKEVIPRELNFGAMVMFESLQRSEWYIGPDGRILMSKLIEAFQQFFRENSEIWLERFSYREAGPHLLLQAFLQRVVNGGGQIFREYGLGMKRTDLLVVWKWPGGLQREVIELKVANGATEKLIEDGIVQTVGYMDRCGAEEGHLVVMDRRPNVPWESKIYQRDASHQGRDITVWGM